MKILGNIGNGLGYVNAAFSGAKTVQALANKQYDLVIISGLKTADVGVNGASAVASVFESGNKAIAAWEKGNKLEAAAYVSEMVAKEAGGAAAYLKTLALTGGNLKAAGKAANMTTEATEIGIAAASDRLSDTWVFRTVADYTLRQGW